jgi:hypothetical protein
MAITPITPPTAGSPLTVTGNYTPPTAADVSTYTTPWTLVLEVYTQTLDATAVILFQDSLDGFVSDILAGPSATVSGGITTKAVVRYSWKQQDWPDLRIGITGAELRAVVQRFAGGGSLQFRSWIE